MSRCVITDTFFPLSDTDEEIRDAVTEIESSFTSTWENAV
jgi:hypothetical protein